MIDPLKNSGAEIRKKASQADSEGKADVSLSEVNRPVSLVVQVKRILLSAFENNTFPNGLLPTLDELANQLCVGRETVRLALGSLQEEGLVVKRQQRGTFVLQHGVKVNSIQPNSKVLGYLMQQLEVLKGTKEIISRLCSSQMLEGAVQEASRCGYQLNIRSAKSYELRETYGQMEASGPMRGVIFDTVVEEKFFKGFGGRGIPSILLDHDLHVPSIGSIRSDSEQNATLSIKRLAEMGHRRIACASCQLNEVNPWFIQGYRIGMRELGLRRRRAWEMFIELSQKGAHEVIEQLLNLSPRPTAIICFHNTFANQLLMAALERELRVPADISVVGCGGEDVVHLSCTQLDWSGMGRTAVQMLLEAIDQGNTYEPEHRLVPYEWREGRTATSIDTEESPRQR